MSDKELKCCPFCGELPSESRTREMWDGHNGFPKYGVTCDTENCLGKQTYANFPSLLKAREAWNTRATPQAADEGKKPIMKLTVTDLPLNILNPQDFSEIQIIYNTNPEKE